MTTIDYLRALESTYGKPHYADLIADCARSGCGSQRPVDERRGSRAKALLLEGHGEDAAPLSACLQAVRQAAGRVPGRPHVPIGVISLQAEPRPVGHAV